VFFHVRPASHMLRLRVDGLAGLRARPNMSFVYYYRPVIHITIL
jgi:hypothetical protein